MGELINSFIPRRLDAMPDEFLQELRMDQAGLEPGNVARVWTDEQDEVIAEAYRKRDIHTNIYDWAHDEELSAEHALDETVGSDQ